MLGIGNRQDKYTKIKLLAQKSKEYNKRYDELIAQGLDPQEVASVLQKEEYERRHQGEFVEEPYKIQTGINQIGGAVHQGFSKTHQAPTETQTLYGPLDSVVKAKKTGTATNFNFTKSQDEVKEQKKVIERIQKDHLAENFGIDFGQKKTTDYKLHFNDDQKMRQIREKKDKQYNQRKNDLNWYVETYIKTKDSLRKC